LAQLSCLEEKTNHGDRERAIEARVKPD